MQLDDIKVDSSYEPSSLVSTGISLFNLALSDYACGGFKPGTIVNIIGDSHTGKSMMALTCLAEIANNPEMKNYHLVYDDCEAANSFNLTYMFGKELASKIRPPSTDSSGNPIYSNTVQKLWDNLAHYLDSGVNFVYVLDSLDSLDSEDDQKKVVEQREARAKGNKVAGSYGMSKAKTMSAMFKDIPQKFKKSNSIFIVISQVRENVDPSSFQKFTRAGGKALKFYASHEIWLAHKGFIKKKDIKIGSTVRVDITKNRLTGKNRTVDFPLYYDYGVDSIGASVAYLVANEWWKTNKRTIEAHDLGISGTELSIIKQIEDGNLESALASCVEACWRAQEDGLKLNRKSKYAQ